MAAGADPHASLFGPSFTRAFSGLPSGSGRIYLASLGGKPASFVMTSDNGGNCSVDLVATVPEARSRGLSSALLGHALADAAERGCETTTLVSTLMARSLYKQLGYRAICQMQQWERRRPGT
jgi:GNAT superfamily N-acetyltransferase